MNKQLSKGSALARGSICILQEQTLLSKCHVVSRYTCHGNLIYAHKTRTSFPTPIHQIHKCSRAFAADIMYKISPKSDNKCGE